MNKKCGNEIHSFVQNRLYKAKVTTKQKPGEEKIYMKQLGVICMQYGSTNKRYKNNNMSKYIWEVKLNKNPVNTMEYIKNREKFQSTHERETRIIHFFLK